ncbi:response regulator transcription factor [Phyllobacterium leguminum]|uniref:Response regulator receiver domain-containing protein n=1 Tax=Phyllobacterium leguminum TaxID=314237 RepID=A0A318SZS4_9HYPH|nr:response regulator [Phyllobacterium leguminum]PYE86963.1 response regulator receiver domain-containing protein [Phyllobacterium leguminum]
MDLFEAPVIAIVEDDEAMREALSDLFQVLGLPCHTFERAETFLAAHESGVFDCLITDVRLPGISGLDLLQRLKTMGSTMPVIVVTSHTDPNIRSRAIAIGAHAYLTKPLASDALLQHLKSAVRYDFSPGDGYGGNADD